MITSISSFDSHFAFFSFCYFTPNLVLDSKAATKLFHDLSFISHFIMLFVCFGGWQSLCCCRSKSITCIKCCPVTTTKQVLWYKTYSRNKPCDTKHIQASFVIQNTFTRQALWYKTNLLSKFCDYSHQLPRFTTNVFIFKHSDNIPIFCYAFPILFLIVYLWYDQWPYLLFHLGLWFESGRPDTVDSFAVKPKLTALGKLYFPSPGLELTPETLFTKKNAFFSPQMEYFSL